jgi:glycosyltransferase involved in cell wall biosynthesis
MRILLIAPHPFYQDRGTPIAVDMLLRVLSSEGHEVDVCTFPEGETRTYPGVTIHRPAPWGRVTGIAPGFSVKKVYTDLFLLPLAVRLCRDREYDVVHAIEEAGFFGLYLKFRYGVPYVYDMDSVLSDQLIESRPWLRPLRRVLESLEGRVVAGACVLAPMCEAVAERVHAFRPSQVVVLRDVSLIEEETPQAGADEEDLRRELGIEGPIAMYIGNLEPYQGIDLMLESFAHALRSVDATLVVIGGQPGHISQYQQQARELGIGDRVRLIGPRPVSRLAEYLRQADVLVSPRTKGNNTPMKIYSYLHSGVALLATALPTHTQVLNSEIAELASPDPAGFGQSLAALLEDGDLRAEKSRRAAEFARREHSFESFQESVRELYRVAAESCQRCRN